ncbi:unnamed protein product [Scytosiphon promiscuus]
MLRPTSWAAPRNGSFPRSPSSSRTFPCKNYSLSPGIARSSKDRLSSNVGGGGGGTAATATPIIERTASGRHKTNLVIVVIFTLVLLVASASTLGVFLVASSPLSPASSSPGLPSWASSWISSWASAWRSVWNSASAPFQGRNRREDEREEESRSDPERQPRCWTDSEGKGRCLPSVFFFGVSKCGTTSLSNWLAEHPRTALVPPAPGHDFREAHVFDLTPKAWHNLDARGRAEKLAAAAAPEDTVIDFTPHYAVMGEAPLRIADFYDAAEGRLRETLRFLVVLREPVARTISSWEYKSAPLPILAAHFQTNSTWRNDGGSLKDGQEVAGAGRNAEGRPAENTGRHLATASNTNTTTTTTTATVATTTSKEPDGREVISEQEGEQGRQKPSGYELRSLQEAFLEGKMRAEKLSACVKDATDAGLFGREATFTLCRTTKGKNQCLGHPPCEICNTHTEPWCNPRDYLDEVLFNAHVGKSMYAMQLQRWFGVFGRESFKVIFTEEIEEDPLKTLGEIFSFLGLDMIDPEGEKGLRTLELWDEVVRTRYNTADRAKKQALSSQVTEELRRHMRDFFAPHNKELQRLLGVPLPKSWHVA